MKTHNFDFRLPTASYALNYGVSAKRTLNPV